MTNRRRFVAVVAVLCLGALDSGCTGTPSGPTPLPWAPSIPPTPSPTQRFTLSGTVSEFTTGGLVPLEGALIETFPCPVQGSYTAVDTDSEGHYVVPGMCPGSAFMWVFKAGYRDRAETPLPQCEGSDCYIFTIVGDTRVDVELVRDDKNH